MTTIFAKDPLNIIICGVGGQGNILASELLASTLVENGYYATVGETYGASQRGGSVMSHVRVSAKRQFGPLISAYGADIIIGFEPSETLKVARMYANKNTRIIFNIRPNYPTGVLSGAFKYPKIEDIKAELGRHCQKVYEIDASQIALNAGDPQVTNIVLVGALIPFENVPVSIEEIESVLKTRFSGSTLELNFKVLRAGYSAIRSILVG